MEENIGCRISRLRKAQDIGVYQLAEQARVSAKTVYRWEHGNVANIKESILERLAPILGVTKYYIKTGLHGDVLPPEVEDWLHRPKNMEKIIQFYYREIAEERIREMKKERS